MCQLIQPSLLQVDLTGPSEDSQVRSVWHSTCSVIFVNWRALVASPLPLVWHWWRLRVFQLGLVEFPSLPSRLDNLWRRRPLLFEQIWSPSQPTSCSSFPHCVNFAAAFHRWPVHPNLTQNKAPQFSLEQKAQILISFGRFELLKVRNRVFVGTTTPFLIVTRQDSTTLWSFRLSFISSSFMANNFRHRTNAQEKASCGSWPAPVNP